MISRKNAPLNAGAFLNKSKINQGLAENDNRRYFNAKQKKMESYLAGQTTLSVAAPAPGMAHYIQIRTYGGSADCLP